MIQMDLHTFTHRESRWKKTSMQMFQGGQSVARSAAPSAAIWVQHSDLAGDPAVASTQTHCQEEGRTIPGHLS